MTRKNRTVSFKRSLQREDFHPQGHDEPNRNKNCPTFLETFEFLLNFTKFCYTHFVKRRLLKHVTCKRERERERASISRITRGKDSSSVRNSTAWLEKKTRRRNQIASTKGNANLGGWYRWLLINP